MKKSRERPIANRGMTVSPRLNFIAIRIPNFAFRNLLIFISTIAAIWILLPKPPLLDGVSFSQSVRDSNGEMLRVTLSADQKFRIWTPLREIAPELVEATLQYEDKYFARHPGVNPVALVRSGVGVVCGAPRTGASTITM